MLAVLAVLALILPTHTPGAYYAKVTQANIHQTVCVPGFTRTIRPPSSYTRQLKIDQLVAFGYQDQSPAAYEEDHLISLELGGAPYAKANLWPEPWAQADLSDPLENRLHAQLCGGQLTLAQAQARIVAWKRRHG